MTTGSVTVMWDPKGHHHPVPEQKQKQSSGIGKNADAGTHTLRLVTPWSWLPPCHCVTTSCWFSVRQQAPLWCQDVDLSAC